MRCGRFLTVAIGLFLLLCGRAYGHDPFEVTTGIRIEPSELEIEVTMLADNALLIANEGRQINRPLEQEAEADQQAVMKSAAAGLFHIEIDNTVLHPEQVQFHVSDENDAVFLLRYPRRDTGMLKVDAIHLKTLGEGYTSALSITQQGKALADGFRVLHSADTVAIVQIDSLAPGYPQSNSGSALSAFKEFFVLGFEHILEGLDHLLFLAGVLIVCKNAKETLVLVTSFTLAHSFTLFLTALNAVTLPAIVVEPLIAASIIYIGMENALLSRDMRRRYVLTFVFGLIHGLGFSAALQSMNVAQNSQFIVEIASFNLGVEAVQVILALALLPAIGWLRRTVFYQSVVTAVSLAISAAGLFWFVRALT